MHNEYSNISNNVVKVTKAKNINMTKQFSIQNELTSVRNDLNVLSADELFSQYGIIINEDGTVFDDLEQKTFENKTKWVQHYGTVLLQELQEEQERERWEDEFSDEEDH